MESHDCWANWHRDWASNIEDLVKPESDLSLRLDVFRLAQACGEGKSQRGNEQTNRNLRIS